MFTQTEKEKIKEYYKLAIENIEQKHLINFKGHTKPLFLISESYPGVWLEHVYDSVLLARIDKKYADIARYTLELFMQHQDEYGQIPCYIMDRNRNTELPEYAYTQVQECVSFAKNCFGFYNIVKDLDFLKRAYEVCIKWVGWYEKYRLSKNGVLVETFSGFDTGHDRSGRFNGVKYTGECKNRDAKCRPDDDEIMPLIAPDTNAAFYGNIKVLSLMAKELGLKEDSKKWFDKSEDVKKALYDVCYDKEDDFFYDVDKNGSKRKYLSISITNLFLEHFFDKEEGSRIYEKHLHNPEEFYTKMPFPSMAVSDPSAVKNCKANSWGYYVQANTIERLEMWMDYYGKSDDYEEILARWIRYWTFGNKLMFAQELDPKTAEASESSPWYAPCLLAYIYGVKRLNLL